MPPLWNKLVHTCRNWWLLEITSLLISIASLTVLTFTLKDQNGQYPDSWAHTITFNTFIVILSTISRITLLLPVTSAISQTRWLCFRKSRSLFDFQVLDTASRGPWGSTTMMLRLRSPLAMLCATVIVAAVAFESFTQQSINIVTPSYVPILTTFGSGTGDLGTLLANRTLSTSDFATGLTAALDLDSMSNAYNLAQYDPEDGITNVGTAPSNTLDTCNECHGDPSVGYICACDTPPYATINICSACEDLSADLSYKWYDNDTHFTVSLPNGVRLDSAHDLAVFSARDYLNEIPENRTMLSRFDFIGGLVLPEEETTRPNGSLPKIQYAFNAGSCSLWFCGTINQLFYIPAIVDTSDTNQPEVYLEASLAAISLSRTIGSSASLHPAEKVIEIAIPNGTSLITFDLDPESGEPFQPGLEIKEWNSTMPVLSMPFSVVQELRAYLFSMWSFTLPRLPNQVVPNPTTPVGYFQRQAGLPIWIELAQILTGVNDVGDFLSQFNSLKIQMSNWLRIWMGGNAPNGYDSTIYPAYIHVRWEWMILPWILEVMTIVLLAYTIWRTHKTGAPVWKDSILASMFHGVHLEDAEASAYGDIVAMEAKAKEEEVRLTYGIYGHRLAKVTGKDV